MPQEFYHITNLLAHLRLPAREITEAFYRADDVSAELAAEVLAATGLDVRGFSLVLDRSGIQHTFKKHGLANAASEIAQGQIPIEEFDFVTLAEWLATPERVCPGQPRPGQLPMPCVEFYFTHSTGLLCAVLEFRPGRQRLVLVTMYKKRPTA